jgi:O-antigen/teichoic acid export membrane protein
MSVKLISQVSALFLSRSFVALSSFILAPWYVQQLGHAGFGVIALFASLLACMVLFDMGLSTVATTRAATLHPTNADPEHRSWLGRAEKFYWLIGLTLSALIASLLLMSPQSWISAAFDQASPAGWASVSLILACLCLALTWPQNYYSSVATGLQRQTQLAQAISVCALVKIVSVVVTLYYSQNFLILFTVLALNAALLTYWLQKVSYLKDDFGLDKTLSWKQWRHELSQIIHPSLWAISAIGTILNQGDKIFLSALLPVNEFAAYAIAALLCTSLYMIISPLYAVFLPYFVRVLREDDAQQLEKRYLLACGLTVVLVLPAGFSLAAFAPEILSLWLKDPAMIYSATEIVPWLALGSTAHGLLYPSYALQLAAGWTQLALRMNLALLCVTVPLIYFGANRWGGVGAAVCWTLLNLLFLIIWPALVHRKMLPKLGLHWYARYVALPALVASLIAFSAKLFLSAYFSDWSSIALLLLAWLASLGSVILVTPLIKQQALDWISRKGLFKRS